MFHSTINQPFAPASPGSLVPTFNIPFHHSRDTRRPVTLDREKLRLDFFRIPEKKTLRFVDSFFSKGFIHASQQYRRFFDALGGNTNGPKEFLNNEDGWLTRRWNWKIIESVSLNRHLSVFHCGQFLGIFMTAVLHIYFAGWTRKGFEEPQYFVTWNWLMSWCFKQSQAAKVHTAMFSLWFLEIYVFSIGFIYCTTYDDLNPFWMVMFRFKGGQHTSLRVVKMHCSRLVSHVLQCWGWIDSWLLNLWDVCVWWELGKDCFFGCRCCRPLWFYCQKLKFASIFGGHCAPGKLPDGVNKIKYKQIRSNLWSSMTEQNLEAIFCVFFQTFDMSTCLRT